MFWKPIFLTFLIGVSHLFPTVKTQRVEVNSNLTVDYILTYESDSMPQDSHRNLRFPTIYYDSPAFITFHNSLEDCQRHCATLDSCTGVYQDWNQSLLMTTIQETYNGSTLNISGNTTSKVTNSDTYCYLLSDLGLGYEEVNITSKSYTKIQHHNFSKHLGNNTISVVIFESSPANQFGNSTTYLDLNHNGVLDDMEPNISTQTGVEVVFQNLSAGRYLVRTESPNFCHQLFPGMRGDDYYFMIAGDGYIDTVNTYYHHAHSSFVVPHGGYIDKPGVVANRNFSFILGSDNNTYLSFYPENNITVGFIDETVVNEIVIEVYGDSSTHAHVSVSHNNIDFYPVGILESQTTRFNLTDSGFNLPVAFVKLHFMGTDPYVPLNIVRIYSPQEDVRTPEFGFLIGLPIVDPEYIYYNYVLFYHDCYNNDYCEDFCYYMSNNFNREESCLTGCNIFYETENCQCQNWQNINTIEFNGDEFDVDWCYKGCHYELGWSVGPEFVPLVNHTGISTELLLEEDTCPNYCLFDLYDRCLDNTACNSFSYDLQTQGELYGGWQYRDSPGNFIMLRRNNYSIFTELTTTSTTSTSITSSSTTSATTTSATTTSATTTSATMTSATVTSTSSSSVSSVTVTTTYASSVTVTNTTTSASSVTISTTSASISSIDTSTSTSSTNTNRINEEESGSGLDTSTQPSNSRSSSSNNRDNTVLSVLVSLFIVILLGFGIIGYVIYKRRTNIVPQIGNNNQILGFDNPVYNHQIENNRNHEAINNYANYPLPGNQDVLYQDTDGYQPDADYLEIQE